MERLWNLFYFYIGLNIIQLCSGLPINNFSTGGWNGQTLTILLAVIVSVSAVIFFIGCVCCQRRQGFKEFRDSPVSASVVCDHSEEDPGHVNPIATSEFTIFTPLSPPHHNNNVFRSSQVRVSSEGASEPACKVNTYGLDLRSWFDGSRVDFPRNKLKYIRELGSGWFGRVVQGEAQGITDEQGWTPVAVRILESCASAQEQALFLNEASMYKLEPSHPNVLQLLGYSLEATPLLLIQEFCSRGDLKKFLLENANSASNTSVSNLPLRFCCQLTAALQYLHEHNIPHPDLAARTCQLMTDLTVKLGDYGTAVNQYPRDYYQGVPAIPVRWCAPEMLNYTNTTLQPKQVTNEGNIWSLGVTMWEICEWGNQPYDWLTDDEVISQVLDAPHIRLPKPNKFSAFYIEYLYRLMQLCWSASGQRPDVNHIYDMLIHLLQVSNNSTPLKTRDFSAEDFDSRWDNFKPNTIVKTDNHIVETELTTPEKITDISSVSSIGESYINSDMKKSASLTNLHGSFDNLLTDEENATPNTELDSWLQNIATDTGDMSYVQGLSQAIHALDSALASEQTSSSSSSYRPSPGPEPEQWDNSTQNIQPKIEFKLGERVKRDNSLNTSSNEPSSLMDSILFTRNESGSETEDETWKKRIERGAYSEKVRQKSKSVADLMILTHIDCSDTDSETPLQSLELKVSSGYKNVRCASRGGLENSMTYGSEGNLLTVQDTFQEELRKLQEERRDSLLFVPAYNASSPTEEVSFDKTQKPRDESLFKPSASDEFLKEETHCRNMEEKTATLISNVDVNKSESEYCAQNMEAKLVSDIPKPEDKVDSKKNDVHSDNVKITQKEVVAELFDKNHENSLTLQENKIEQLEEKVSSFKIESTPIIPEKTSEVTTNAVEKEPNNLKNIQVPVDSRIIESQNILIHKKSDVNLEQKKTEENIQSTSIKQVMENIDENRNKMQQSTEVICDQVKEDSGHMPGITFKLNESESRKIKDNVMPKEDLTTGNKEVILSTKFAENAENQNVLCEKTEKKSVKQKVLSEENLPLESNVNIFNKFVDPTAENIMFKTQEQMENTPQPSESVYEPLDSTLTKIMKSQFQEELDEKQLEEQPSETQILLQNETKTITSDIMSDSQKLFEGNVRAHTESFLNIERSYLETSQKPQVQKYSLSSDTSNDNVTEDKSSEIDILHVELKTEEFINIRRNDSDLDKTISERENIIQEVEPLIEYKTPEIALDFDKNDLIDPMDHSENTDTRTTFEPDKIVEKSVEEFTDINISSSVSQVSEPVDFIEIKPIILPIFEKTKVEKVEKTLNETSSVERKEVLDSTSVDNHKETKELLKEEKPLDIFDSGKKNKALEENLVPNLSATDEKVGEFEVVNTDKQMKEDLEKADNISDIKTIAEKKAEEELTHDIVLQEKEMLKSSTHDNEVCSPTNSDAIVLDKIKSTKEDVICDLELNKEEIIKSEMPDICKETKENLDQTKQLDIFDLVQVDRKAEEIITDELVLNKKQKLESEILDACKEIKDDLKKIKQLHFFGLNESEDKKLIDDERLEEKPILDCATPDTCREIEKDLQKIKQLDIFDLVEIEEKKSEEKLIDDVRLKEKQILEPEVPNTCIYVEKDLNKIKSIDIFNSGDTEVKKTEEEFIGDLQLEKQILVSVMPTEVIREKEIIDDLKTLEHLTICSVSETKDKKEGEKLIDNIILDEKQEIESVTPSSSNQTQEVLKNIDYSDIFAMGEIKDKNDEEKLIDNPDEKEVIKSVTPHSSKETEDLKIVQHSDIFAMGEIKDRRDEEELSNNSTIEEKQVIESAVLNSSKEIKENMEFLDLFDVSEIKDKSGEEKIIDDSMLKEKQLIEIPKATKENLKATEHLDISDLTETNNKNIDEKLIDSSMLAEQVVDSVIPDTTEKTNDLEKLSHLDIVDLSEIEDKKIEEPSDDSSSEEKIIADVISDIYEEMEAKKTEVPSKGNLLLESTSVDNYNETKADSKQTNQLDVFELNLPEEKKTKESTTEQILKSETIEETSTNFNTPNQLKDTCLMPLINFEFIRSDDTKLETSIGEQKNKNSEQKVSGTIIVDEINSLTSEEISEVSRDTHTFENLTDLQASVFQSSSFVDEQLTKDTNVSNQDNYASMLARELEWKDVSKNESEYLNTENQDYLISIESPNRSTEIIKRSEEIKGDSSDLLQSAESEHTSNKNITEVKNEENLTEKQKIVEPKVDSNQNIDTNITLSNISNQNIIENVSEFLENERKSLNYGLEIDDILIQIPEIQSNIKSEYTITNKHVINESTTGISFSDMKSPISKESEKLEIKDKEDNTDLNICETVNDKHGYPDSEVKINDLSFVLKSSENCFTSHSGESQELKLKSDVDNDENSIVENIDPQKEEDYILEPKSTLLEINIDEDNTIRVNKVETKEVTLESVMTFDDKLKLIEDEEKIKEILSLDSLDDKPLKIEKMKVDTTENTLQDNHMIENIKKKVETKDELPSVSKSFTSNMIIESNNSSTEEKVQDECVDNIKLQKEGLCSIGNMSVVASSSNSLLDIEEDSLNSERGNKKSDSLLIFDDIKPISDNSGQTEKDSQQKVSHILSLNDKLVKSDENLKDDKNKLESESKTDSVLLQTSSFNFPLCDVEQDKNNILDISFNTQKDDSAKSFIDNISFNLNKSEDLWSSEKLSTTITPLASLDDVLLRIEENVKPVLSQNNSVDEVDLKISDHKENTSAKQSFVKSKDKVCQENKSPMMLQTKPSNIEINRNIITSVDDFLSKERTFSEVYQENKPPATKEKTEADIPISSLTGTHSLIDFNALTDTTNVKPQIYNVFNVTIDHKTPDFMAFPSPIDDALIKKLCDKKNSVCTSSLQKEPLLNLLQNKPLVNGFATEDEISGKANDIHITFKSVDCKNIVQNGSNKMPPKLSDIILEKLKNVDTTDIDKFNEDDINKNNDLNDENHVDSTVFTSTPFIKRINPNKASMVNKDDSIFSYISEGDESNQTSVILGPCEDYTLELYSGLKTTFGKYCDISNDRPEEEILQFSSNFMPFDNEYIDGQVEDNDHANIDYSLDTWDKFLGKSLQDNEKTYDSFSPRLESLKVDDSFQVSYINENNDLLHKTIDLGGNKINNNEHHSGTFLFNDPQTTEIVKENEKEDRKVNSNTTFAIDKTFEVPATSNAITTTEQKDMLNNNAEEVNQTFNVKPEKGNLNSTFDVEKANENEVKMNTTLILDKTYDKPKESSEVISNSWEPGEGWFLHPQTPPEDLTGQMDIQIDNADNSYIGFTLDEECVNALRTELAAKLPHAQGLSNEIQEPEDWDGEERNEVIVKYNVYATPLSPIPEESCCDDMFCDQMQHREGSDSDSDWSEPVRTSHLEDILVVDTETHTALILESPSPREPLNRHTPSQDSCCSNDTLFNLEDLNYGPLETDQSKDEDTTSKEEAIIKIDNSEESGVNSSEEPNQSNEKAKLKLNLEPGDLNLAPLPSPEDIPWRQLPASMLTYSQVALNETYEMPESENTTSGATEATSEVQAVNLEHDFDTNNAKEEVASEDETDLYNNLTDIRFSGPCDTQLMSTSFSESAEIAEDRDWDSGSDTRSSSSGEFIWKGVPESVSPMEAIAEENSDTSDEDDDEEEIEETEFVPSAWDSQATPTKSALRSPEKSNKNKNPKGVWFKKEKYHCVYEYPREPESPVAQSSDLWRPSSDFSNYTDLWELDPDSCVPAVDDDGKDCYETSRRYTPRDYYQLASGSSQHRDLYQLNSFPDFGSGTPATDEDFFISSSAKPFQTLSHGSQFFPGLNSKTSLWQDYQPSSLQSGRDFSDNITPDSGIDDITPASISEQTSLSYAQLSPSKVQSLKTLAAAAANKSSNPEVKQESLGGLRHTRNRLKLDLPPSPSSFTSTRSFNIELSNDPIVNREVPTFTTFGKSRFSVQHVPTPTEDDIVGSKKAKNVSFEALPHKPFKLEEVKTKYVTTMTDKIDDKHKPVEVVRGEASLLDSADEDSGIESSANATLERQQVLN